MTKLTKFPRGGGGGCRQICFAEKQFFLALFRVLFYFQHLTKYWKVPLHLLVKREVVSPNSRWGQWKSISNMCFIPLFWSCISNVGVVGGGGGGNVLFSFYAISNISRRKNNNSGNTNIIFFRKTILFHLMWFFVFFYARSISNTF